MTDVTHVLNAGEAERAFRNMLGSRYRDLSDFERGWLLDYRGPRDEASLELFLERTLRDAAALEELES